MVVPDIKHDMVTRIDYTEISLDPKVCFILVSLLYHRPVASIHIVDGRSLVLPSKIRPKNDVEVAQTKGLQLRSWDAEADALHIY